MSYKLVVTDMDGTFLNSKDKISVENLNTKRCASVFSKTAGKFKSNISIVHGSGVANAKSIINIMSLGLKKGEEIKIVTKGTDEKEAMDALVGIIEEKFGEK